METLNLTNPEDIYEYPEEDKDKYENLVFKTKPTFKYDGNRKANTGNKCKFISNPFYLK